MSKPVVIVKIERTHKRFPLWSQFINAENPQPCGLELDLRTGTLTTFVSGQSGEAKPEDITNNVVLRFPISPYTLASDILGLIERERNRFETILDGCTIIWDGEDHVGDFKNSVIDLFEQWVYDKVGFQNESALITVDGLMKQMDAPVTMEDFNQLVSGLMERDGAGMFYNVPAARDWIEHEVLEYIIDTQLCQDLPVGQEIAQLILQRQIDIGEWDKELARFAAG